MMTDPIGDMLTRIRNAVVAKHATVDVPHSKLKLSLAAILKSEGYVADYDVTGEEPKLFIRITLKYPAPRKNSISGLERVSHPGHRKYVAWNEIPRVKNGLGIAILTSSKGILTDRQARRQRVGGEILCTVW